MSVKIIFVRHGQSTGNVTGGFYDEPKCRLTKLGEFQAELTGLELGRMIDDGVGAVYCSTYERAIQTCTLAMMASGIEYPRIVFDDRIRERGFAGLVGRPIGEDGDTRENAVSPEDYQKIWTYGHPIQAELKIETVGSVIERMWRFLNDIARKHQNEMVIVFSHGGVGRVMHAMCKEWPEGGCLYNIPFLFNAEVTTFQI